eukprot:scaffold27500_cov58-Phaeocystis_antarctica.AAC.2
MRRGFSHVGQVRGRPSPGNEIIDDVFVNATHIARYYPQTCAFAAATSQSVAGAVRNVTTFEAQLTQMKKLTKRAAAQMAASRLRAGQSRAAVQLPSPKS